ncbi:hypothetical protein LCGC14_0913310 [marine sediment metagenome]|uniref:Uncharacterized protein n=1 Tax=marine sediment metagenome TaxID=412755 RepID=A0A0F9PDQ8_9ZZZZ
MEELTEKIAEWLGFTIGEYPEPRLTPDEKAWYDPKGMFFSGFKHFMDFPNDIDACFRYIDPQLYKGMTYGDYRNFMQKWLDSFTRGDAEYLHEPALALCRAVEKLIDGENAPTSKIPTHCKQIGGSESSALGR